MTQAQMPVRASPYAHQQQAFEFVCRLFTEDASPGAALLMEMGTGKTLTTIGITGALWLTSRIRRVLIVAPLSIVGVWQEEFAKFADFRYNLAILTGTGAKKADTLRAMTSPALQIAVVNYESAWRMEEDIKAWRPDLVVCDEGHKIKSHSANASKAMHRVGAAAKFRLLLTGTPVTNKAQDIFSQYKFLNPDIFGKSFYGFRNRYFDMTGYGAHTPVMKRQMEQEFTQRLHCIAFRATKAECLDLPDTVDIVRLVELEPAARRTYRDLVRDSYAELAEGSVGCETSSGGFVPGRPSVHVTNILTRLMRLSQLTGGFIGNDDDPKPRQISKAKLTALQDIIDQAVAEGQKLVQ